MEHLQNLYYALGELAYAVAKADGTIHKEEKKTIHDIVIAELKKNNFYFENLELTIRFLQKDNIPVETIYVEALDVMRSNHFYFDKSLKEKFIGIIQKIADAFPPITLSEQSIIDKFKRDINKLPL